MFLLFLYAPLSLSYDLKPKGIFCGLKKSIFQSVMMQFRRFSRTGEAVQGTSDIIIGTIHISYASITSIYVI